MQTTKINIVQNDKGYDLNFTLQDNAGNAVNITGATLAFKVQKENGIALKFTGSMAIVSAAAGTCKYTVQTGDFDEAGRYDAEIELTLGAEIITYPGIKIEVSPELPKS